MAKVRLMETLNQVLTWEPLISLFAILGGWLWGFWERFTGDKRARELKSIIRSLGCQLDALKSHQADAAAASEARHYELVDLNSAFAGLPQAGIGEGVVCGELPDGANLVRLADGSFRLTLPVRAGAMAGGGGTSFASASARMREDDQS